MRLIGLSLRGLTTAFPDEVVVDFESLPRIVAVVGDNGQGKTTLLEATLAALYRRLRSRDGSLYEYVPGEALVESTFVDGAGDRVVARLQVDGPRRKTEQHILVEGRPVTTGREAEVADEVRRRFGSLDLISASIFQAQDRSGDLVGRPRADRKALFAEMLDLGRYAAMSKAAGGRADALQARLLTLQGEAYGLGDQEQAVEGLEAALVATRDTADAAAMEVGLASDRVSQARERVQGAEIAGGRAAALLSAAEEAQRGAEAAGRAVTATRASVETASRAATAAETRKAEALRTLTERAERAGDAQRRARVAAQAAQEALAPLAAASSEAGERTRALWVQVQEARASAEDVRVARSNIDQATARVETERKGLQASAALLDRVPCTEFKAWDPPTAQDDASRDLAGTCPLLASAVTARDRLPTLAVDQALVAALSDAEDLAGLHRAAAELEQEIETARAADHAARVAHETKSNEFASQDRIRSQAENELRHIDQERARAEPVLEREIKAAREDIRASEKRFQAAEAQAAEALARAGVANEAARGVEVVDLTMMRSELRVAEGVESMARKTLDEHRAIIERQKGQLEQLHVAIARMRTANTAAAAIGDDLSDYRMIESALGRDGVQTFEVDAAGPAVAAIVNELLSCWSARFSLKFETLRAKKGTEGGYTEVFDILVYDNDGNAWRKVEDLCGGEKVFVKEALSLGIAVYNARRSGQGWRTFFRDEADGQLSEQNAIAWLAMLRRAADLGGFEQVLFITHRRALWERADACLLVAGGTVTVADASEITLAPATVDAF